VDPADPAASGTQPAASDWAQRIDALLPQTQCTRCGEPDCARYARAIADGAPLNRCPPGGAEGIARLAALTGRPVLPLDPAHGVEAPRRRVWIDETACIGCTLCIKACPVDAIVGAPKRMHHVLPEACTGCDLCLPACPVDCIHGAEATPGLSGWAAWSPTQAAQARERYQRRNQRLAQDAAREAQRLAAGTRSRPVTAATSAPDPVAGTASAAGDSASRQATIEAALARARARRGA
jgi:electron transport complex protein RnfB